MLLGFKTELKLNSQQRVILAKHAGVARHAYNWGLALCQKLLTHNREHPEEKLKFPTAIDLHKLLVANVSGMMANHKLAKAIADMGFFEFRRQLAYKCQLYGSQLVVIDRFFPSSKKCSNCGAIKESLSLSERVFRCVACSFECDRDFNASINLEQAVESFSTVTASRLDSADTSRMKEEENASDC